MKGNDNSGNVLLWVAIVLFVLSAGWLLFSYVGITGNVTSTGTANVTVTSSADINFTTDNINWGPGIVASGAPSATLDTFAGTVTGGNWTAVTNGFVIENLGNVNVTLALASGKNATSFIGGGNGHAYQYRVSEVEAGACVVGAGFTINTYYDVNMTSPGTFVCSVFGSEVSKDTIEIDLKLVIPSDSKTGALGDTITATAAAVA